MKFKHFALAAIVAAIVTGSVLISTSWSRAQAGAKEIDSADVVAVPPAAPAPSGAGSPTIQVGDGLADLVIPADLDGDGIPNAQDNCPLIPNPPMAAGQPQLNVCNATKDGVVFADPTFPSNMTKFLQQQRQIILQGTDADGVINAMDNAVSMANAMADRGLGLMLLNDIGTVKGRTTDAKIAAAANGFESILLINLEGAGPNFTVNPLLRFVPANPQLPVPSLPGVPQEAAFTGIIPYLGCQSIVKETKGLVWIPWPGDPTIRAQGVKYWDIFAPAEFVKKISICREARGVAPTQYVKMEVIVEGLLFRFRAFWPKADP